MDRYELTEDIRKAINKNSADSMLNLPDFILAEFLVDVLMNLEKARIASEQWYTSRVSHDI